VKICDLLASVLSKLSPTIHVACAAQVHAAAGLPLLHVSLPVGLAGLSDRPVIHVCGCPARAQQLEGVARQAWKVPTPICPEAVVYMEM
jgi:hypothetical protein